MKARASILAGGTALALIAPATKATDAGKPTNAPGCTLNSKVVRASRGVKTLRTTLVVGPYKFQLLRNAI